MQPFAVTVAVDTVDGQIDDSKQHQDSPDPKGYLDGTELGEHIIAIHLVDDSFLVHASQLGVDGTDEARVVTGIAVFAGLQ